MLNHNKLAAQIAQLSSLLFPDLTKQSDIAQKVWKRISQDPSFVQKVLAAKSSFLIPDWFGNLSDAHEIKNNLKDYSVLAVDGSQIYPDRNVAGAGCFLINIGGCFLEYGNSSKVDFFSEPAVFLQQDFYSKNDKIAFSQDMVDLKREELELKRFLDFAKSEKIEKEKTICFLDGSLIFWHLEGKQPEVKELFLNSYLEYFNQFYENKILHAGFISFPKSRELVNLIKLGLCRFTAADCISCHSQYDEFPCKVVDSLIDSQVVRFFLKPNQRTTIFKSKSKITQEYPDALKPYFFYLYTESEIVRIEIPFWITKDTEGLDLICSAAMNQCKKGQGYPVCLAEAHEQAVVKGGDREFFYHLIRKIGVEQKKRFFVSQKSLKKRGIRI